MILEKARELGIALSESDRIYKHDPHARGHGGGYAADG